MTSATTGRTPGAVPQELLDQLYQGPAEDFTSARNAIARQLRSDGEAEAAAWVKALRKPTRAAWIVNQLQSRKREELEDALERGAELRRLQEQLLAGEVDRDALRQAARAEQGAIESLMKTAEAIGNEHGVGAAVIERVAETLQAASSDPEVAEAIGAGRLQREARATSLGLVGPATPAPKRGKAAAAPKGAESSAAAKAEEAERQARRDAARRRRAAERTLAAAERRIERERTMAERARQELTDRERRLEEAEREAAEARRELTDLEEG